MHGQLVQLRVPSVASVAVAGVIEPRNRRKDASMQQVELVARVRVGREDTASARDHSKPELILCQREEAFAIGGREPLHSRIQRWLTRALLE